MADEVVRTGPAYGPGENADDTRQAQHQMLNDAPVDVNLNAMFARSQGLTLDALGKGFASNQDLRDKAAGAAAERRQIIADQQLSK